jgi:1-phosphofructokinase family hexose kinase
MSILTLTLNPSIDHILIAESTDPGTKNLLKSSFTFYGGKGINAAFTLGKLGISVCACGFIGQDDQSGLHEKLIRNGILPRMTTIHNKTRHTFKVMQSGGGKDTEYNEPGEAISNTHMEALMVDLDDAMRDCKWLILSGSIPRGVPIDLYATLIQRCNGRGIQTILDTSGEALKNGIHASPTVLRINRDELHEIFPECGRRMDGMQSALAELHQDGISYCAVSLGEDGALGFDGEQFIDVHVPKVRTLSLTGAGDAMTAGMVASLNSGRSFAEALRYSAALATASTLKMEPGDFDNDDFTDIYERTTIVQSIG